jgi:hypothetical protein
MARCPTVWQEYTDVRYLHSAKAGEPAQEFVVRYPKPIEDRDEWARIAQGVSTYQKRALEMEALMDPIPVAAVATDNQR